jgi:hypothetical protein
MNRKLFYMAFEAIGRMNCTNQERVTRAARRAARVFYSMLNEDTPDRVPSFNPNHALVDENFVFERVEKFLRSPLAAGLGYRMTYRDLCKQNSRIRQEYPDHIIAFLNSLVAQGKLEQSLTRKGTMAVNLPGARKPQTPA